MNIYDLAGNITEIKLGDKKIYEYAYDVHGRITKELDYVNKTGCTYGYTSTGNVVAKHIKEINNDGNWIVETINSGNIEEAKKIVTKYKINLKY